MNHEEFHQQIEGKLRDQIEEEEEGGLDKVGGEDTRKQDDMTRPIGNSKEQQTTDSQPTTVNTQASSNQEEPTSQVMTRQGKKRIEKGEEAIGVIKIKRGGKKGGGTGSGSKEAEAELKRREEEEKLERERVEEEQEQERKRREEERVQELVRQELGRRDREKKQEEERRFREKDRRREERRLEEEDRREEREERERQLAEARAGKKRVAGIILSDTDEEGDRQRKAHVHDAKSQAVERMRKRLEEELDAAYEARNRELYDELVEEKRKWELFQAGERGEKESTKSGLKEKDGEMADIGLRDEKVEKRAIRETAKKGEEMMLDNPYARDGTKRFIDPFDGSNWAGRQGAWDDPRATDNKTDFYKSSQSVSGEEVSEVSGTKEEDEVLVEEEILDSMEEVSMA
ncbi:uncharacterized protein MELLADRAFT_63063 [Melampsora larici-populina 98AG31]|uniref:Uncharacterized protein n=1 Tax=Melampsora larici-populina (strain 98AG31 / pathotype 3-4-7) TaxID=747676 RepID=F4RL58_MELLP|nr:uncharacterized protein MELLADRAFT_63063 [Melampsora larici-populina 98AG31]EGG06847.1 hypothetical protein MELLADRAFT_63063 [Melampsora larici-populina 98AG31]